jgi:hypothetical protein
MAVEAQLDPARRLWAWVAGLLRRVFGRSVRVPYSKVVADYHSAAAQFLLDPTDIDVGREFDSAAEELLRRGF